MPSPTACSGPEIPTSESPPQTPSGSRNVKGLSNLKMHFGRRILNYKHLFEPNEGQNLVPAWSDPAHHRELGHLGKWQ